MKLIIIFLYLIIVLKSYANVNYLWEFLIKVEGKNIVKEPTGDYSKYGLRSFFIKKYNKKYSTTYNIHSLNEDQAKKIFEEFFYKKYYINNITDKKIKILIVDTIYNQGTSGIKIIQKSINKSLNNSTLQIDGKIGVKTISELNKVEFEKFKRILKNERIHYYRSRKNFKKYGNGWLQRLEIVFDIS